MNVELIMQNLRIVSMIEEQSKLVTNPAFGLRPATTFRALVRRWLGENRDTDLQNLRNLFGSALCIARLNEAEAQRYGTTALSTVGAVSTDRLLEAVCRALDGLRILERTYHDDRETCAKLELLVQEVRDHVNAIRPGTFAAPPEPPSRVVAGSLAPPPKGCDTEPGGDAVLAARGSPAHSERTCAAPPEDLPPLPPAY